MRYKKRYETRYKKRYTKRYEMRYKKRYEMRYIWRGIKIAFNFFQLKMEHHTHRYFKIYKVVRTDLLWILKFDEARGPASSNCKVARDAFLP